MNDHLTAMDIQKMKEELYERQVVLMPKLIEEVKRTRAFGDLSENFEYKMAKQDQNRNKSRIRYLQQMIKSAVVIEDQSSESEIGLFDTVEIYLPESDKKQKIQVVTTVRCNPLKGLISRESPLGKALLGRRQGEKLKVETRPGESYPVEILNIEKGKDDGSVPLLQY